MNRAISRGYNRSVIVMYLFMGLFLATHQTLVPHIADSFGAGEQVMGYMISAVFGGSTAAVILAGELAARIGKRTTAAITSLTVAIGAGLIALSQTPTMAIIGYFFYGTGIGGHESTCSSLATDNNPSYASGTISILNALFSVGAMLAPLILSALIESLSFRFVYGFAALCYLSFSLYFFFVRGIDSFATPGDASEGLAFLKLIRHPIILGYMLGMFIHIGVETALTYWIGSTFTMLNFASLGAVALSSYWLSSILGRILASRVKNIDRLLAPCFFVAALAIVLFVLLPSPYLKIAMVVVTGLSFSPLYGWLCVAAGERFPSNNASAFSLMIFSAGIGGIVFQPGISLLISLGDTSLIYYASAFLCLACGLVLYCMTRRKRD